MNKKLSVKSGRLLPAYPIFVKDPYFSIWSPSDKLNGGDTSFWAGFCRRVYGAVSCEGRVYSFMGLIDRAIPLTQTEVSLTAFTTDYSFTCDDFDLDVSFVSPLDPTNLEQLSCPVCFMDYKLTPKKKLSDVKVCLYLHEESCYDKDPAPISGGVMNLPDGQCGWFGRKKQMPMSHSFDHCAADWGYWYLMADRSFIMGSEALLRFIAGAEPVAELDGKEKYLFAYGHHTEAEATVSGTVYLAFDDTVAISYFGTWLKGYYFRNGKTVIDALAETKRCHDSTLASLSEFDSDLMKRCEKYGDDYLLISYGALRQAIGAHKLCLDPDGKVIFLSKECHSNGCLATVDVSYPSVPLFLLYNPELVKGLVRPIFKFNDLPVWEYDFAPHDIGTYPIACGQTYGVDLKKTSAFVDCRNNAQAGQPADTYTYPPFYLYPKGSGVYTSRYQMPVEECGNMLIMCAAALVADGDVSIVKKNFKTLSKWVKYLVKYGLMPGEQLCTDDFAGHLDKNINLSVKAIVGIRAYSIICERLGKTELAEQYKATAEEYAAKWREMCYTEGKHIPLVFDGGEDTFSLKYNMAFDVLFGTGLFAEDMREVETDYYIKAANKYGIPLDSRSLYTKSDWILWSAVLTGDTEKRKAILAPVAKMLRESNTRYAFTDWYFTDSADLRSEWIYRGGALSGFKNRTVVGGMFMLLLDDSGKMNI